MLTGARIPPQATDVEKHILGGLWLGNPEAYRAFDKLTPADFYTEQHAALFATTKALFTADQTIDLVTVSARLQADGNLDAVGGEAYLCEISNEVVSCAGMDSYCDIVREMAGRRKLITDATSILESAYDTGIPMAEVQGAAQARILDDGHADSGGPVSAKDALISTLDLIERVHKGEMQGLQTQFYAFNEASGGLCAPDWIVLAGRPATGKTALALDMADYLATDCRKSVLFLSLEMGREQLMQRVICRRQGIDFRNLRTGKCTKDELSRIYAAISELKDSPLYIDDCPDMTPSKVLSIARRHKARHGLDLLIVDNLSIMGGDSRSRERLHEVTEITREFKKNAKRLNVPIMTLVHLNRSIEERGEDAVPRMRDLRECGTIEQDADNVYVLHKPDPDGTLVHLHGLKQRNGESGVVVPLESEFRFQRFKSYEGAVSFGAARAQ